MRLKRAVTVEYWPHTNKYRIMICGVAVGYWDSEEEARTRARQVRRGLAHLTEPPVDIAHEFVNGREEIEDETTHETRPMTPEEKAAWDSR